jgi:hypothetical protein
MSYSTWCKGKDLRTWADSLEARQKLPALVRRLIHATVENPKLIQFPADEGTQRRGWDGILEADCGNAWIPKGKSVWEMGADQDPEVKANGDFKKRTENPGTVKLNETTFVFITPRKWEGKTKWLQDRRTENKWLNILVWDCDDFEQWLETAPAVDAWLARLLGKLPAGEIVRGFDMGVHNQRGVTTRGMNDGGEQERELVKKYRAYAEKCKVAWPRTALALRRIAEYYEVQAKWQDEHAEARD